MSRMSRPRAVVATGLTLGTAAAGLFLAPVASAAVTPTVTAPATVVAGADFTVSGTGCVGTELNPTAVAVYSNDAEYAVDGFVDTAADGSWSVQVHFAAAAQPAKYPVYADCIDYDGTGGFEYDEVYTDVTAPAPAGTPTAPTTTPVATSTPAPVFTPGAKPNTPGVSSTSTATTTGSAAAPGQKVVKVLKGFQPGEKVTVVLHSAPVEVGVFTADANGVVTIEFTVPAGTPLGTHTLVYQGDAGTYFEEALVLTADGKALAYTGASIAMPLIGGSVLVAAGAGALLVTRRRRSPEAAQA
jgi:hypothetical protein